MSCDDCSGPYWEQRCSDAREECRRLRYELALLRKQNAAAPSATDAEPYTAKWYANAPTIKQTWWSGKLTSVEYLNGAYPGIFDMPAQVGCGPKYDSALDGVAVHDDFGAA